MTVYGDPLMLARQFYGEGARYLHMVDLDGAFTGEGGNKALALEIARQVPAKIQLGGGIRDMATIERLLGGRHSARDTGHGGAERFGNSGAHDEVPPGIAVFSAR